MHIHQIGNIVTIYQGKEILKQFKCDCSEEAKRIADNLKKNGGFMDEVKLSTILKKLNAGIK